MCNGRSVLTQRFWVISPAHTLRRPTAPLSGKGDQTDQDPRRRERPPSWRLRQRSPWDSGAADTRFGELPQSVLARDGQPRALSHEEAQRSPRRPVWKLPTCPFSGSLHEVQFPKLSPHTDPRPATAQSLGKPAAKFW